MTSPVNTGPPVTSDGEDDRFLIRSRVEIAFILKAVMQAGEIVTAYFNDGKDFLITALLGVDGTAGTAILGAGNENGGRHGLLPGSRVAFVTSQDKVKIQFEAEGVTPIEFEGRPGLLVPLPGTLLKYQRREYYRVATPVTRPLKCVVTRRDAAPLALSVVDISLGGVCLAGYPEGTAIEPGMTHENCRIDLAEVGTLTTSLQVRNAFEVPLRTGAVSRRAGCMFFKLQPASEAMIQRYIIRLERDRRARLMGK
jgi:c-di-GMP-binding flagellar brake protein YcgR